MFHDEAAKSIPLAQMIQAELIRPFVRRVTKEAAKLRARGYQVQIDMAGVIFDQEEQAYKAGILVIVRDHEGRRPIDGLHVHFRPGDSPQEIAKRMHAAGLETMKDAAEEMKAGPLLEGEAIGVASERPTRIRTVRHGSPDEVRFV